MARSMVAFLSVLTMLAFFAAPAAAATSTQVVTTHKSPTTATATADASAAPAQEPPAGNEYSMTRAVTQALLESLELRSAGLGVEKAEEQSKQIGDALLFIPTGYATPEVEAAFYNLVRANYNLDIQKKDRADKVESVILSVYQRYMDVLIAETRLETAKKVLERDELNLRAAKASYRVGVIAKPALAAMEAKTWASRSSLEAAKQSLDKAYVSFNRLVGLNPGDRPVLTDKAVFSALETVDIETEVLHAVDASVEIWKLNKNVDLQKVDLQSLTIPVTTASGQTSYTYRNYDVESLEVDIAKLTLEDVKKKVAEQVRLVYADIRSLEEQYAAVEGALASAEENFRVANVQYKLGMITKAKLAESEAALSEAKQAREVLLCQHNSLKATFRKLTGRPVFTVKN